jgi:hypothetical protein
MAALLTRVVVFGVARESRSRATHNYIVEYAGKQGDRALSAPEITLVSYIRDLGLLPRALPVLRPFVARVLVALGSRAAPDAEMWALAESGADEVMPIAFRDDYAALNNEIAARVTTPLLFQLDWDEIVRPDHAAKLPELAATMARLDLDCTYVALAGHGRHRRGAAVLAQLVLPAPQALGPARRAGALDGQGRGQRLVHG